jgi:hypothetical protein
MAHGLLIVESRPASPEQAVAYHHWYENKHIPEMLQLDGFVSARRLEPLADDDGFVTLYEIEGDVEAAKTALMQALSSGAMSRPEGVRLDPPPTARYFREISPAL